MINRWIYSTQRHLQSMFKHSVKDNPCSEPHFRLCYLCKQPGDQYGFNVQETEDVLSTGHVIKNVAWNSPAHLTGIRPGDRIIEVNGCNVENENYEQLSNRIRAGLRLVNCSPVNDCEDGFNVSEKNIVESMSSSDSGVVSESTSGMKTDRDQYFCPNECMLLVLNARSYQIYKSDRLSFMTSATTVYKKSTAVRKQSTQSCQDPIYKQIPDSKAILAELKNDNVNPTIFEDCELLSSSNQSFDDIESHVGSSMTTNDCTPSNKSDDGSITQCSKDLCIESSEKAMKATQPKRQLSPRLCYLKKANDFNGYGFNLVCPRSSNVQVIGKVEPGSPANKAGLLNDDVVIEVNGVNVLNENHRQVVTRITEGVIKNGRRCRDEVILLVVDPETKRQYDEKAISINHNLPNISIMGNAHADEIQQPRKLNNELSNMGATSLPRSFVPETVSQQSEQPTRKLCKASIEITVNSPKKLDGMSAPCSPAVPKPLNDGTKQFGIYLDMTAAEMREILRKRGGKRNFVDRYNKMTMMEKYQIVQNM